MIKRITHFLIIFFIFQQLKSQISQIDQNGYNAFCDETLHMIMTIISPGLIANTSCKKRQTPHTVLVNMFRRDLYMPMTKQPTNHLKFTSN